MQIIHSSRSAFQHIMLVEQSRETSLVLDGKYQTQLPNDDYYAVLLGPNDGSHSVSILGGGDLTAVRVLHALEIEDWRIFEIDPDVIDVCTPFCGIPRKDWADKIVIGDALAALKDGTAAAGHIIVDLLAMTEIDALSAEMRPRDFIRYLCMNAKSMISGFTAGGPRGILLNELMRHEFTKHGFDFFYSFVNTLDEAFFVASKADIDLSQQAAVNLIGYPVYPKSGEIRHFSFEEQLLIIREAF